MKAGASHVVPLSDVAIELLKRQAERRSSDFIFPGRNGGKPSYSNFQTAPRSAGIDAATAHGWRSVLRDAGEDILGIDDKTLEACLAHRFPRAPRVDRPRSALAKLEATAAPPRPQAAKDAKLSSHRPKPPKAAHRAPEAVLDMKGVGGGG
jgi:integrase